MTFSDPMPLHAHGNVVNSFGSSRDVWGVLGGAGPVASAEFLRTVYAEPAPGVEQELPIVLLHSDPSIPDRTEAVLAGRLEELARETTWRADRLLMAGATRLLLCCITLHPVIPLLPLRLRERIVSLVDLIFDEIEHRAEPHLMLCTIGTRQMRLFDGHKRWPLVSDRIVLPNDRDQQRIHQLIYDVKRHRVDPADADVIGDMMRGYGVQACVAGCTEIHVVARTLRCEAGRSLPCVDPLAIAATVIRGTSVPRGTDASSIAV